MNAETLRAIIAENRRKGALKRRKPRIPSALKQKIIDEYKTGIARGYLGPKYKLPKSRIDEVLKGLKYARQRKATPEQRELIKKLYTVDKLTMRAIAHQLNLTSTTVFRVIHDK